MRQKELHANDNRSGSPSPSCVPNLSLRLEGYSQPSKFSGDFWRFFGDPFLHPFSGSISILISSGVIKSSLAFVHSEPNAVLDFARENEIGQQQWHMTPGKGMLYAQSRLFFPPCEQQLISAPTCRALTLQVRLTLREVFCTNDVGDPVF